MKPHKLKLRDCTPAEVKKLTEAFKNKPIMISDHASGKKKCHHGFVPKTMCYIHFSDKMSVRMFGKEKMMIKKNEEIVECSKDVGYTVRGEQMIADYNKKGEVIGIELLSSKQAKKPCMGRR